MGVLVDDDVAHLAGHKSLNLVRDEVQIGVLDGPGARLQRTVKRLHHARNLFDAGGQVGHDKRVGPGIHLDGAALGEQRLDAVRDILGVHVPELEGFGFHRQVEALDGEAHLLKHHRRVPHKHLARAHVGEHVSARREQRGQDGLDVGQVGVEHLELLALKRHVHLLEDAVHLADVVLGVPDVDDARPLIGDGAARFGQQRLDHGLGEGHVNVLHVEFLGLALAEVALEVVLLGHHMEELCLRLKLVVDLVKLEYVQGVLGLCVTNPKTQLHILELRGRKNVPVRGEVDGRQKLGNGHRAFKGDGFALVGNLPVAHIPLQHRLKFAVSGNADRAGVALGEICASAPAAALGAAARSPATGAAANGLHAARRGTAGGG